MTTIISTQYKLPQSIVGNGVTTGNQFSDPNNILMIDGNVANSQVGTGETSDIIVGNFTPNLPIGSVVTGIRLKLVAERGAQTVPDITITPVLVNDLSGTNEYYPGDAYTGLTEELENHILGNQYDLWGKTSWTVDEINNLKVQLIASGDVRVDCVLLEVFYYDADEPLPPDPIEVGCEDCNSTIEALPFTLAKTFRADETKFILKTFALIDGTPIDLSMLGDCGGEITITFDQGKPMLPGQNFQEDAVITSADATITTLSNGFVEIDLGTITNRGLLPIKPYTHNAELLSEHAVGTKVIISNSARYQNRFLQKCHIGVLVSPPIQVLDEGDQVVSVLKKLNFKGDNVQAEQDLVDPQKANVTVVTDPTNVTPEVEDETTGTTGSTPATSLTIEHTIVDANYLRVWVSTENETISSVTYDGVSMTLIGQEINAPEGLKVALYGLVNPNVGANDIVVTMANSVNITAGGVSFLNVDTGNPTDGVSSGAIGTSAAPSDSITTTVNNTVIQDVVGTKNNPTVFAQSGLWTIRGQVNAASRPGASSTRKLLVPGLATDTYALSGSFAWAMILAGVRGQATVTPGSGVQSVTSSDTIIDVDNTDPQNPVLSLDIVELTNNVTFQSAVNNFVSGSGTLQIDQTPDNGTYGLLAGAVDGTNDTYTVSLGKYGSGKLQVYLNGLIQLQGASDDFVELVPASGTFKFNTPPVTSDIITVVYSGNSASVDNYTVKATTDDTTPSFLEDKINIHSSDSSVLVTKTITNPSGDEIIDIDLSALLGGGGGSKLAIDTTQISTNNQTFTTLYTVPIPGGILGTNNAIRFKVLLGNLQIAANKDLYVKFVYGGSDVTGTLLFDNDSSSGSGEPGVIEGVIVADNATNAQKGYSQILWQENGTHNTPVSYGTGTVDASVSQNLELQVRFSDTGCIIRADTIIVEKITEEVSGGSNTIPLIAGNTFTGGTSPQSFIVMEGQELTIKADTTTFSANFGDVDSNSKYCFQLNVKEGQSVNIDLIKIVQITGIGTNSDNLKLSIQANLAGAPDGTDIYSSTIAGFTGTATKDFAFTPFELNAPVGGGDKNYFVVLERTGSLSVTNYYVVSLQNTGGTNQSPKKYNSSTLAWSNDNKTVCNGIYYTYLDGLAYIATRGDSGTASANGDSGTLPGGSRIFCYDVSSSGGGWYTDSIFAKQNGVNIGRSRGFIKTNAIPGATVIGIVSGIVSGFTGLEPGKSYSLPSSGAAGTLLQFAASANDVGVGQAITSTSILIHRESA